MITDRQESSSEPRARPRVLLTLISGLARLTKSDLWLVEQLFLRGRTEATIAAETGITQQAVNKRKSMILLRLRGYMTKTSSRY